MTAEEAEAVRYCGLLSVAMASATGETKARTRANTALKAYERWEAQHEEITEAKEAG